MGALLEAAAAIDSAHHMRTYARKPVMFVRGDGMRLYDDEGAEYLDFVGGIGSVNLGHAHPAVAEAVSGQMARLVQTTNLFYVEHRSELAETVASLLGPARKVFFCNSGAESVEGAIKLARRWGRQARGEGCHRVVAAERSFHGRTFGALSATGQPSKQEAFAPLVPGFSHVPLNDIDALDASVDQDTCAVLLEPIQGEGGVHPCQPGYLEAVRRLCDEREVLLVLDEVQTGFWRTGTAFAQQAHGVEADVTCLAKAMANGLPMGAVVARAEVAEAFAPGDHGSTFAGGPVVCAAARATIASLRAERLGETAAWAGAYLRSRLQGLAERTGAITEVRGEGQLSAAELATPRAARVAAAALTRGMVLNNVGESVLRFIPPLVCGRDEVDAMVEVLGELLEREDG